MGEQTLIEWTDSTCNGEMGCGGCELAGEHIPQEQWTCYALSVITPKVGLKGWPSESFFKPELFPGRIEKARGWKDLTGTARPTKPWLDGMPRLIFLNDLGDTFTESLPIDWLLDYVPMMEASPHIWQILTKRPARMREFFRLLGRVPYNFWPGVSVTSAANRGRIAELLRIPGAPVYWCSYEPALGPVDFRRYVGGPDEHDACHRCGNWFEPPFESAHECPPAFGPRLGWVIAGAESGSHARRMEDTWIRDAKDQCAAAGVPVFFKQAATESGKKISTPDLDGKRWTEMPKVARAAVAGGAQ